MKKFGRLLVIALAVVFVLMLAGCGEEKNSIGAEFAEIKPGSFHMGEGKLSSGKMVFAAPNIHHVTLTKGFYMGKHEITEGQWYMVMGGNKPVADREKLPAAVSRDMALEFIKKLNEKEKTDKYRLPTNAEWEYAARAGTKTLFFFGEDENQLGEYAWFKGNSDNKLHPVGTKKPNPWGLFDVYGNVSEWTQDRSISLSNKRVDVTDPMEDDGQRGRSINFLIRGGSCSSEANAANSVSRPGNFGDYKRADAGFRLVKSK